MADMIDKLFRGNVDLSLLELKKGSAYNKKRSEILTLLEALEENEKKAAEILNAYFVQT